MKYSCGIQQSNRLSISTGTYMKFFTKTGFYELKFPNRIKLHGEQKKFMFLHYVNSTNNNKQKVHRNRCRK